LEKYYDLGILLGSQIKFNPETNKYSLAKHTLLKAQSAILAPVKKIIISGGPNFFVLYDNEKIKENPDFSFEAFSRARMQRKSEAEVIKDFMVEKGFEKNRIFLEELSSYTAEQAKILATIMKRTTFDSTNKIGIITLAYHMVKAFPLFKKEFGKTRFSVEPLFSEDILASDGYIDEICRYYSEPKGGIEWPVKKIRGVLSQGGSMRDLDLIKF